jgi:hypothetical protein
VSQGSPRLIKSDFFNLAEEVADLDGLRQPGMLRGLARFGEQLPRLCAINLAITL